MDTNEVLVGDENSRGSKSDIFDHQIPNWCQQDFNCNTQCTVIAILMHDKNISIEFQKGSKNCKKNKILHNIVSDIGTLSLKMVTSYENYPCRT